MVNIKYDFASLKIMTLFERITRARIKDVIIEDAMMYFVVQPGEMAKAIGKQGANIKKLQTKFQKKIRIVEYNILPELFLVNLIKPLKVENSMLEGKKIVLISAETSTKGKIIGRNRSNLNKYLKIVKRYFDIDGIDVK